MVAIISIFPTPQIQYSLAFMCTVCILAIWEPRELPVGSPNVILASVQLYGRCVGRSSILCVSNWVLKYSTGLHRVRWNGCWHTSSTMSVCIQSSTFGVAHLATPAHVSRHILCTVISLSNVQIWYWSVYDHRAAVLAYCQPCNLGIICNCVQACQHVVVPSLEKPSCLTGALVMYFLSDFYIIQL